MFIWAIFFFICGKQSIGLRKTLELLIIDRIKGIDQDITEKEIAINIEEVSS
jgi:hypothetical protein